MTASLWVLFALLVGFSLGEKTQKGSRRPRFKKGYRTLDNEGPPQKEPVPVSTDAARSPYPMGGDLSNIGYMLNQLNENQRLIAAGGSFGGCGGSCGGCCRGCVGGCCGGGSGGGCGDWLNGRASFTPNETPQNDGDLRQMTLQFYQDLKNDIAGLSQGMSQYCSNAGLNTGPSNDITSLLSPILNNQQVIIGDLGNLIKTVTNYLEGDQARLKKQTLEWESAAAQFQTSYEQLRVEMVRQLKKLGDQRLCPVNPQLQKEGGDVEDITWRITQPPVASRRLRNGD